MKMKLATANQRIKIMSKPQLELFNMLNRLFPEKKFQLEFVVDWFSIDVALPENKLAIELDGDFWHAHWKHHERLYPIQLKNEQNDKLKQKHLLDLGWKVIRVWESELKNPEISTTIKECIENGKNRLFG